MTSKQLNLVINFIHIYAMFEPTVSISKSNMNLVILTLSDHLLMSVVTSAIYFILLICVIMFCVSLFSIAKPNLQQLFIGVFYMWELLSALVISDCSLFWPFFMRHLTLIVINKMILQLLWKTFKNHHIAWYF